MYKPWNIVVRGILSLSVLLLSNVSFGQATASAARQLVADKSYNKAIDMYAELYGRSPDSFYVEYVHTLTAAQKYKQAEQVIAKQMTLRDNPFVHIDLGNLYEKEKKEAKAKEQFDIILQMINRDDIVTQRVVKAFSEAGRDDYAITAYERAVQVLGNSYMYSGQLAGLYARTGNVDKAVEILLAARPGQYVNVENAKTILLEILGQDVGKLQQAQKALIKKINEEPDNNYYAEILTWIYTQKNDWDGALIQMEAIDERNKENGKHLMEFARTAAAAKQYEIAEKAYDDIIVKGKEAPYYNLAKSERLSITLAQIENNPAYKPEDVTNLSKLYDSFFAEYPKYYAMQVGADYATLLAQYGNDVSGAIAVLKRGIGDPDVKRDVMGRLKVQLGDYQVLAGRLWEASLTYSQVDKEFKQDPLGEDARFRNAKLAYYRGDFVWAQSQLSLLKASTSDLISNDAIDLSVLITENVPDSDDVPLQRFAYAGLLLFQNKDAEVETLLDSIAKAYPKHPLNDDILMMRADMAIKHRDYIKSIEYLKKIKELYGDDVLGDDAVFKMADIYQTDLHQNDLAKQYYEQLIIDYPGSTYVQTARQKLNELNSGTTP
jgi:tetratricopeptide (TPR) repeat protein